MTDTRRRVKVYILNEDRQWQDRGTGHVSSGYVEHLKGTSLMVRAERDGSLLLESKIKPTTVYQKQQETLIIWSEAGNCDVALSFQHKRACDEIWEKISKVLGKNSLEDATQDGMDKSEEEALDDCPSLGWELPPCELSRLEDLEELVASSLPSPLHREKLALAVEKDGSISKLLELFRVCEDLDNREGLHHLYRIMKGIFLLNRSALLELMFSDECIMDIIGCLEYDPALPQPVPHREFLTKTARFKEVIPISDPELRQKIHQTYRVEYIQNVVLPTPSVFEENMLSALHSFVFFNKVEIVCMLQDDDTFLTDLFAQLTDDATEEDKRHELVSFLKEFCLFSQTLQSHNRDAFFKTLSSMGILPTLEVILGMDDVLVRGPATDIFSYLVEYNPSMVQEFVMQESREEDDDDLLINMLIEHMTCDTDPELGGAMQVISLLQTLVDPQHMLDAANKPRKAEFLSFFYKNCMHVLVAPLLANTTEEKPSKDDFQTAQLLALILELLTFCVEHHTHHIKNYIVKKDILRRVLVLTATQHTFLALSTLRFMRRIIGLKDEYYNHYIMSNFLFEPIIKAFLQNGPRYNLLNSAIIEMFEYILVEDVKSLAAHIVENYWKFLEDVDYVDTFKGLKLRYDRQRERQDSRSSILRNHRSCRDAGRPEDEEELWFKIDEDNFEGGEAVVLHEEGLMERKKSRISEDDKELLGKSSSSGRQNSNFKVSFAGSLSGPSKACSPGSLGSAWSSSSTVTATTQGGLMGLVDYLGDEDDEEEEEGEIKEDPMPPLKKSKLSS